MIRRCAEPGCPHVVRWTATCPAHRTTTNAPAYDIAVHRDDAGRTFVATDDVAAWLLDIAAELPDDDHEGRVLRGIARGLARTWQLAEGNRR